VPPAASAWILGHAVRVTRNERHMGYLTPNEMGFVLTRWGFGAINLVVRAI